MDTTKRRRPARTPEQLKQASANRALWMKAHPEKDREYRTRAAVVMLRKQGYTVIEPDVQERSLS